MSCDGFETPLAFSARLDGRHRGFVVDSSDGVVSDSASLDGNSEGPITDLGSPFGPLTGLYTTLYDEELLDQYLTTTYHSISSKESVREVYRYAIPKEALSHEHLMHGMLAISAAHLMHTRLDRRNLYETKARRHQQLGKQLPKRPVIGLHFTIPRLNFYASLVIVNHRFCRH